MIASNTGSVTLFLGLTITAHINALAIERRGGGTRYHENDRVGYSNATAIKPTRAQNLQGFPNAVYSGGEGEFSEIHTRDQPGIFWLQSRDHIDRNNVTNTTSANKQPDQKPELFSLESVEDLTDSIKCNGPNEIALKFKTKEAMEYAISTWSNQTSKNSSQPEYFYLVADHEGCRPDVAKHPHKVISLDCNIPRLTAVFKTEDTTWDETSKKYEMTVFTYEHGPVNRTRTGGGAQQVI
ncbi:hypothetical protein H072_253 [Dactylellina haptotyla CBS 200.50]|uniref:DUF7029 domain-containing protein n=1 Tax=Dactylellina haptotyla (strain CBS 200.50) TaxID=1284197 RepID=S8AS41_DACHA|nr:hypothetical protein H072_253 [Dactylellina haptotyla CBS 200.50]